MFFLCRLMEHKSLVILDDRSHMMCVPLLSQANHTTRQKSRSTGIVLTVFPWILEVNASKEEKSL